jgi:hypothetical protein
MRDVLMLEPVEEFVQVQDEPALEIALPQVFTQPELTLLQRGKLPHVEELAIRFSSTYLSRNGTSTLGPDYQELVNEFQPLFTWAIACWDYLLSTEGCRFILRAGDERLYCRGDYRAVTDKDYSRLVHRIFRQCVLDFAHTSQGHPLAGFLRTHFWDAVLRAYRKFEDPPDPRQRKLTPYSYLRCVPYQFLNSFHHELVYRTVQKLSRDELRAIELYFLRFHTLPATSQAMNLPSEAVDECLRRGLLTLLIEDRLVYCLLRQIERY